MNLSGVIQTKCRAIYSFIGLLLCLSMYGTNINHSSEFNLNDRKIYCLNGYVSDVIHSDGTIVRFDETGKLIRNGNTQYSYQEPIKYVLEHGIVRTSKINYSGNVRTEISEDTGKKTEVCVFDDEGRLSERVIYYPLLRKYQYFYEGSEKNPCKEVYHCDTIPSGALTFYYLYLKTDKEGNWLQRSVKVSGGKDASVNRLYVDTRRLKYHLIPENTISTSSDVILKLGIYESNLLNLSKTDGQNALKRGNENFVLIAPENVEAGAEFEIAYEMKEKPKETQISNTKPLEFLYYDFRENTVASKGDTLKLYQLVLRLKAKQKGKFSLPTLKARIGGKLNISSSQDILVTETHRVAPTKGATYAVTLSATLNKDTISVGESAILSLKLCTAYTNVKSVRFSLPEIPSCVIQEINLDSVVWKKIPFEKGLYKIGEYKRYKLTPAHAGAVEILPVKLDCVLERIISPNANMLSRVPMSGGLLGVGVATIGAAVALRPKMEKRNETIHTELLYLHVLP